MLFNSAVFILAFLPAAWLGFFALGRSNHHRLAVVWLTLASLFFYGWWNITYVPLLLGSVAVNYAIGRVLARRRSKPLLIAGIAANIGLLGYYKYTRFLVQVADGVSGAAFPIPYIALPLAISFFTFQQIAFLVDSYDGVAEEASFANYSMFITFFPHLIAGPITHHKEMLPQFADRRIFRPQPDLIALGLTLFLLGLCKKVILADSVATWVRPVFTAAAGGAAPDLFQSWLAAVGYALQLYFDFSGYTDMAIGLGMMFGIRLPRNFDFPYKSRNIIEYWSRFHMTLTRFITAYIYNPITLSLTRARMQKGKPGMVCLKLHAGVLSGSAYFSARSRKRVVKRICPGLIPCWSSPFRNQVFVHTPEKAWPFTYRAVSHKPCGDLQYEAVKRRDQGEETLAEIGRSYNVSGWTISSLTARWHLIERPALLLKGSRVPAMAG